MVVISCNNRVRNRLPKLSGLNHVCAWKRKQKRNNNPHVKRAVFRLPYKRAYTSQAPQGACENWQPCLLLLDSLYSPPQLLYLSSLCWQKILSPENVYFHITIFVNRSVQLVARNRECPKGLNNVPCVVWSRNKLHATMLDVEWQQSAVKFHRTLFCVIKSSI